MIPEDVQWLKGPPLVAWLETQRRLSYVDGPLSSSNMRRICSWRAGGHADVTAVDMILTKLGLHLHDVPEETISRASQRGYHHVDEVVRREVIETYLSGETARKVGKRFGVHECTVRRWVAESKKEPVAA